MARITDNVYGTWNSIKESEEMRGAKWAWARELDKTAKPNVAQ